MKIIGRRSEIVSEMLFQTVENAIKNDVQTKSKEVAGAISYSKMKFISGHPISAAVFLLLLGKTILPKPELKFEPVIFEARCWANSTPRPSGKNSKAKGGKDSSSNKGFFSDYRSVEDIYKWLGEQEKKHKEASLYKKIIDTLLFSLNFLNLCRWQKCTTSARASKSVQ